MSEKDIERLGNRPFKPLRIPSGFAETEIKTGIPKGIEPPLLKNTARLHDFTEKTELGLITFSDELILPQENRVEPFWFKKEYLKGMLFFHFYSLQDRGYRRLKDETAFQVPLRIIREWDVKPGLYFARRNTDLKKGIECRYDDISFSRREDGICKRNGPYDGKEISWHVLVDFNKPIVYRRLQ